MSEHHTETDTKYKLRPNYDVHLLRKLPSVIPIALYVHDVTREQVYHA